MAQAVNYASTPIVGAATLTLGDVSRTAPANAVTLMTPIDGAQIERIAVVPLATVTATVLRIWRFDPAGGGAYHLYIEIPVAAQVLSAGVAVATQSLQAVDNPGLFPILLPAGWSLKASLNDAQTGIQVQAEGGGY